MASAIIEYHGTSFIYGYDGAAGGGRVANPEPAVFNSLLPQYVVRNEGVNSSDSQKLLDGTDGVHTLAWPALMNASDADIVILSFGFSESYSISESAWRTNLIALYNGAVNATKPKRVVFQTVHKVSPTVTDTTAFAAVMVDQANLLGIHCMDVNTWANTNWTGNILTYVPDGYHPNQTQYTAIGTFCANTFAGYGFDQTEVVADRIKETSTTTGTGNFALSGALTSYKRFSDVCSPGNTFYGSIVAVDANGVPTGAWENGLYTYSAANTITRTTVHSSSNSGGTVNFGAGTKHVYMSLTAAKVRTLKTPPVVVVPPPSALTPTYTGTAAQQTAFWNHFNLTNMLFQDEFAGSSLDTSKWGYGGAFGEYEPGNSPGRVQVTGGMMRMIITGPSGIHTNQQFTAGYFVEGRLRLPVGPGVWPAFWLIETAGAEATHRAEPDIMEAYAGLGGVWDGPAYNGGISSNRFDFTLHPISGGGNGTVSFSLQGYDVSQNFHTWGMWHRKDGNFEFYFDGVLRYTTNTNLVLADRALTLVLNVQDLAFAGGPSIYSAPQGSSNAFEVQYVRVWGEL